MNYSHLPKIPQRVLVLMAAAAFVLAFAASYGEPSFPQRDFTVVSIGEKRIIVEIASSEQSRLFGLAGRENMGAEGMLFVFDEEDYHAMWMKGMRFPVDIVWIRNGRIADVEEYAPAPPSGTADVFLPIYRPDIPAEYILEVNAGFAEKYDVSIGDKVVVGLSKKAAHDPQLPGSEYFIENERKKDLRGRDFQIEKIVAEEKEYTKYAISYKTGDLKISGVMNVPKIEKPKNGFPLLILNHGLIPTEIYHTGRGSRREQDYFTKNGYITIHPDYRGHASSSPNLYPHFDFFSGYTEDVLSVIQALKRKGTNLVDLGRIGMWGHSMGGGIAARAMVLSGDIKAYVLFAPNSARAEENFYELSEEEILWLDRTYGTDKRTEEIYRNISPIIYFEDVIAPVQLHHGTGDDVVPLWFSEKMYETLTHFGKKVEFYTYEGERHEFIDDWPVAAERALQFFDKYVKGAE